MVSTIEVLKSAGDKTGALIDDGPSDVVQLAQVHGGSALLICRNNLQRGTVLLVAGFKKLQFVQQVISLATHLK